MPRRAQPSHRKTGQIQLTVVVHSDVRRDRRMKPIAGTHGDMVLEGVSRLASGDEFGSGDNSPQVGARRMVAMLVRGQHIFHPHRIQTGVLDRGKVFVERQSRMGFDQNQPVWRLDQILASQGAMIPPAGHRP